jgi:hypothetical protein
MIDFFVPALSVCIFWFLVYCMFNLRKKVCVVDKSLAAFVASPEWAHLAKQDLSALGCVEVDHIITINDNPLKCNILLCYAELSPSGDLDHSHYTLRKLSDISGCSLLILASNQTASNCLAFGHHHKKWMQNYVLVQERKNSGFAHFLADWFRLIEHGDSMLRAWVRLAPQGSSQNHQDANPLMIFVAAGKNVVFRDKLPNK